MINIKEFLKFYYYCFKFYLHFTIRYSARLINFLLVKFRGYPSLSASALISNYGLFESIKESIKNLTWLRCYLKNQKKIYNGLDVDAQKIYKKGLTVKSIITTANRIMYGKGISARYDYLEGLDIEGQQLRNWRSYNHTRYLKTFFMTVNQRQQYDDDLDAESERRADPEYQQFLIDNMEYNLGVADAENGADMCQDW